MLGGFLLGLITEFLVVLCVLGGEEVSFVFEFNGLGD